MPNAPLVHRMLGINGDFLGLLETAAAMRRLWMLLIFHFDRLTAWFFNTP